MTRILFLTKNEAVESGRPASLCMDATAEMYIENVAGAKVFEYKYAKLDIIPGEAGQAVALRKNSC